MLAGATASRMTIATNRVAAIANTRRCCLIIWFDPRISSRVSRQWPARDASSFDSLTARLHCLRQAQAPSKSRGARRRLSHVEGRTSLDAPLERNEQMARVEARLGVPRSGG